MVADTETMTADAVETVRREATETHPTTRLRGVTRGAIRVGEEAEAAMMTAVRHAETEMAIITGVLEGHVLGLGPDRLTATTALVKTATIATDGIAVIGSPASMAVSGTKIVGILSVKLLPSLLKMNEIDALYLSSSLQPACVLAS